MRWNGRKNFLFQTVTLNGSDIQKIKLLVFLDLSLLLTIDCDVLGLNVSAIPEKMNVVSTIDRNMNFFNHVFQ